jgi:hypothetical protein
MKLNLDRIISIATLLAATVAILLVLKKPAPVVTPPQGAAATPGRVQSSTPGATGPSQSEQPFSGNVYSGTTAPGTTANPPAPPSTTNAKADPGMNSDQISSVVARMLDGGSASPKDLTPDSKIGNGEPTIKDQQVTMDGDIVHGKFLTEIGGKDVWVTISGHMGEKDG